MPQAPRSPQHRTPAAQDAEQERRAGRGAPASVDAALAQLLRAGPAASARAQEIRGLFGQPDASQADGRVKPALQAKGAPVQLSPIQFGPGPSKEEKPYQAPKPQPTKPKPRASAPQAHAAGGASGARRAELDVKAAPAAPHAAAPVAAAGAAAAAAPARIAPVKLNAADFGDPDKDSLKYYINQIYNAATAAYERTKNQPNAAPTADDIEAAYAAAERQAHFIAPRGDRLNSIIRNIKPCIQTLIAHHHDITDKEVRANIYGLAEASDSATYRSQASLHQGPVIETFDSSKKMAPQISS